MTVINCQKIKDFLLDVFFSKKCVGCGKEGLYICKDCEVFLSEVEPILSSPTAQISGSQAVGLPGIVSVWEYEGLMEKLIQRIKYSGTYDIVNTLVEKAFEKITLELPEDTYITYVPMYRRKEKQRGFNQAELIAKKVGEMTERPVARLLEKTKDNRSQVGLNPQERVENVRGVFRSTCEVNATTSQVIVVDDVYTTGATMQECIKVLRKNGVKNVWGFTLARKMNIRNY